jgi:hypothetical protein
MNFYPNPDGLFSWVISNYLYLFLFLGTSAFWEPEFVVVIVVVLGIVTTSLLP